MNTGGTFSGRHSFLNEAYLWLSLGIARHPRPGSREQNIAKSNLYHLVRSTMDQVPKGEHLYYSLIGGDPIAQQYHVREAQELLRRLGHSPGPADGKWGPRSERAFNAWFKRSGIKTAGSAREFTSWMRKSRLKEVPEDARIVLRKMRLDTLRNIRSLTDTASTRRESNLVRFVCQRYDRGRGEPVYARRYHPFVVVLEQTEVVASNTNQTIFGSDLIDPSRRSLISPHPRIPFELTYYRANLISKERTRDEMMTNLSNWPVVKYGDGSPIRHMGWATTFSWWDNDLEFSGGMLFGIDLDALYASSIDTRGANLFDGDFHCEEPILVPQP